MARIGGNSRNYHYRFGWEVIVRICQTLAHVFDTVIGASAEADYLPITGLLKYVNASGRRRKVEKLLCCAVSLAVSTEIDPEFRLQRRRLLCNEAAVFSTSALIRFQLDDNAVAWCL